MGRPVMDGWVSGLGNVRGGGLSSVVDKLSHHEGYFLKRVVPLGDEVPRPRRPALGPLRCPSRR